MMSGVLFVTKANSEYRGFLMTDNGNSNALEEARGRLDAALSSLAQEVAAYKGALAQSREAQEKTIQEMSAQADRMLSLEQENHRLHEQIAALSLQESASDDGEKIASVEAEKNALQQNYDLLKRQYTSLQDEFEGLQNQMGDTLPTDNRSDPALQQQLDELLRERAELKSELNEVIAELESYVSEAQPAAGGMN